MILAIFGLALFNFGAILALFGLKVCLTISTHLNCFQSLFFVMESSFSMEKFPCFAVGFRWKDQDASRARISSWSANIVASRQPKRRPTRTLIARANCFNYETPYCTVLTLPGLKKLFCKCSLQQLLASTLIEHFRYFSCGKILMRATCFRLFKPLLISAKDEKLWLKLWQGQVQFKSK